MRRFLAVSAALALVFGSTSAVWAGQPSSETFNIEDHFVDAGLCGDFDVTIDITGRVRVSTHFDRDGDPVMEINNIALHWSYSANGKTVNVVDTGVDFVSFLDDGSVTVAVTGMVQLVTAAGQGVVGGSTGRFFFRISAGGEFTVISEHGNRAGDPATAICELLAA